MSTVGRANGRPVVLRRTKLASNIALRTNGCDGISLSQTSLEHYIFYIVFVLFISHLLLIKIRKIMDSDSGFLLTMSPFINSFIAREFVQKKYEH